MVTVLPASEARKASDFRRARTRDVALEEFLTAANAAITASSSYTASIAIDKSWQKITVIKGRERLHELGYHTGITPAYVTISWEA